MSRSVHHDEIPQKAAPLDAPLGLPPPKYKPERCPMSRVLMNPNAPVKAAPPKKLSPSMPAASQRRTPAAAAQAIAA